MKTILALSSCLLLSSVAEAQTIYKYRDADGRITYSNEALRGIDPVETFEQPRYPAPTVPAAPKAAEAKARAAPETAVKLRLAALDRAWVEVKDATEALESAQARLAAAIGPEHADPASASGSVRVRAGQVAAGSPAGIAALEADLAAKRSRLERAQAEYNKLR